MGTDKNGVCRYRSGRITTFTTRQGLPSDQAAAEERMFDLALLDLKLPGMDGLELTRSLKADPRLQAVPLVMLTAFGSHGHAQTAQQAGIAAYLVKPVRQGRLRHVLMQALRPAVTLPTIDAQHPKLEAVRPNVCGLVLVAEDNEVNQKLVQRQLAKLGYESQLVQNGREAVEAVESGREYAAVLMDCHMPEMDGFAATAAIRVREASQASGARRLPIIALTADALTGDRERCLEAGMDDYLSKPVELEALERTLRQWAQAANIDAESTIASSNWRDAA